MAIPLRVLFAEDSEDDARLLLRELRLSGYDVAHTRVETGDGLRAALNDGVWDIVISDYNMPGFTGKEALKIVRAHAEHLPFIFVSGSIGEDVAVAAMKAGAQDYVMKGNLTRLGPAIAREWSDAARRRDQGNAEEKLRAANELTRAMFHASPLAFVATDLDLRVKSWNPAAARIFGWREDDMPGEPAPMVAPERLEEMQAFQRRAIGGETISGVSVQRRGEDGTAIDLDVSMTRTHDQAGAPDGLLLVYQDVTGQKRLEAQFRQAQKMEAVGQLAGGVAHDFNNLLTVITSYSDFLLAELASDDPRREDVGQIRSAAEGAAALSRQLLVFSRQKALEPKVVELNTLVAHAGKLLERVIGADHELVVALDESAGSVKADPGQIEQVIMNLAINARDAMLNGGTLTIETRVVVMDGTSFDGEALTRSGRYALLAVSDNGAGMDQRTQQRAFEPFFTTKEEGKGTGLGLATVYGIVKQCDGLIRVTSELGRGTSFKIYLPQVTRAGASPTAEQAPAVTGGTETVLLVEDAPSVRAVARQVLGRLGYQVLEAPDGQTALHTAGRHYGPIHLLVTDMIMPGMNGRELALAFTMLRPETRVIFTSGYADSASAPQTPMDVAAGYIQKPFTPDVLARTVREVLDAPSRSATLTTR
jgi:PAS domain S-box-containing protein